MWKPAVAMLAGVLAFLTLPELPSVAWTAAICLPVIALVIPRRRSRWLLFLPLGFAWCWAVADSHLGARLDSALEGRALLVTGWVHSLPERRGPLVEFELAVESLGGKAPAPGVPEYIRLSNSSAEALPQPGEHWGFDARLRRPRGFMDPGSFDYEGWLFRRGIGATGYVTDGTRLDDGGYRYPLLRLRSALRSRLLATLAGYEFAGMTAALATGDQGGIAEEQWRVLQATPVLSMRWRRDAARFWTAN